MDFLNSDMKQQLLPGMENIPSRAPKAPRPSKVRKETTADTLKSGQLPMFLTAQEIKDNFQPLPGDYINSETTPELWKRKAQEGSAGSPADARKATTKETLRDSIAKNGVVNPVTLGMNTHPGYTAPFVFGGHHRVATAAEVNPNMLIPVTNAESFHSTTTFNKTDQMQGNQFTLGSGARLNY